MNTVDARAPRRAFTLIELLIVVAIIAILAAIAVPNFLEAQTRSKVSREKSDLRALATAWESYRLDYNRYPIDWDSGEMGYNNYPGEWGTFISVTTPVAYITSAPRDVFQVGEVPGAKPGQLYEYWGANWVLELDAWKQSGALWLISGFGPDRDSDTLAYGSYLDFAAISYDPTNGTRSDGDVGRSNIKSFPE
ncbi:MAG TPA: prepilin-type N-terminal cleavage/methylation domain-containing protein [Sumerlaeia bacterium]|nr:prepilin-type N-terminal cleavage/methylation domain-containing protein [Sumerlaeia bacterium]